MILEPGRKRWSTHITKFGLSQRPCLKVKVDSIPRYLKLNSVLLTYVPVCTSTKHTQIFIHDIYACAYTQKDLKESLMQSFQAISYVLTV